MSALVLHDGATVTCLHQGLAQPTVLSPRVQVSGRMVVTLATPYTVTGCGLGSTSTPPCATAKWVSGATRVRASGMPVIIRTNQAICAPTGQGVRVIATQTRVFAT
jgi:hypothetical protein